MGEHEEQLGLAREVLEGLSVGDAIGEALSYRHYHARDNADFSVFRDGTVPYTDDTEMAIAIFEILSLMRSVDEDSMAWAFSNRYLKNPDRGYGKGTRRILEQISAGTHWKTASMSAFSGGSFGNGAAMRVAPLGAYFSDEITRVPELATRSAKVTHYHPEGIAGAIAVAVSAAAAASSSTENAVSDIWESVISLTPPSQVKDRLQAAKKMHAASTEDVARDLGNGAEISAQDTVPFCIWNACKNLSDYKEAIISTIEVGGDCDTNCAIVGGIVAAYIGTKSIPADWLRVREPLKVDEKK